MPARCASECRMGPSGESLTLSRIFAEIEPRITMWPSIDGGDPHPTELPATAPTSGCATSEGARSTSRWRALLGVL